MRRWLAASGRSRAMPGDDTRVPTWLCGRARNAAMLRARHAPRPRRPDRRRLDHRRRLARRAPVRLVVLGLSAAIAAREALRLAPVAERRCGAAGIDPVFRVRVLRLHRLHVLRLVGAMLVRLAGLVRERAAGEQQRAGGSAKRCQGFHERPRRMDCALARDVIAKRLDAIHVRVSPSRAEHTKKRPRFPGAALESEALLLALVLLLDHGLAATTVLDDDLLLDAPLMMIAPAVVVAAIAMLDDDFLADVAVTHAVTMMTALTDLHLHVLRERRSRERRNRNRQP